MRTRRLGDNTVMARNDSGDRLLRRLLLTSFLLDGVRPSGATEWVSALVPAVTQAAVGAGHWAAGRRRRALAAWAVAAGLGLVAWGLGTEAQTRAEVQEYIEQQKDLWRERGIEVPVTARTETSAASRPWWIDAMAILGPPVKIFFGVRSGLRRPRRLTMGAVADEILLLVFYAPRVSRAVQRRRPRIAAGSALVVAGSVARLRAASAEPLR